MRHEEYLGRFSEGNNDGQSISEMDNAFQDLEEGVKQSVRFS